MSLLADLHALCVAAAREGHALTREQMLDAFGDEVAAAYDLTTPAQQTAVLAYTLTVTSGQEETYLHAVAPVLARARAWAGDRGHEDMAVEAGIAFQVSRLLHLAQGHRPSCPGHVAYSHAYQRAFPQAAVPLARCTCPTPPVA